MKKWWQNLKRKKGENMKVIYEFSVDEENDDYYKLEVFKRAHEMLHALNEIEDYLIQLRKDWIKDDKKKMITTLFDILFEHNIGEIQ